MSKMLTKQEIELLIEKAVAWDRSIIGRTTNGASGLFSFLKGKIKNGLNKAKIRSLVTNWGVEYLKALEAVDKNLSAPDTSDPLKRDGDGADGEKSDDVKNENNLTTFKDFYSKIKGGPIAINAMITELQKVKSWITINNTAAYEQLKPIIAKNQEWITNEDKSQICEDFLINPDDRKLYNKMIADVKPILTTIAASDSTPYKLEQQLKSGNNLKSFKESVNNVVTNLQSVFSLYNNAIDFGNNFNTIIKSLEEIKLAKSLKDPEKLKETITAINTRDANAITYFKNKNLNDQDFNEDYIDTIKEYISLLNNEKIDESLILEASEATLPDYITDLVKGINIQELKNTPEIKEKSLEKMNFKMLDIIRYQANYIIDSAKNSTNAKEQSSAVELQKEWDLGIKSLNALFQDLIDVDKVNANVKPNDVTSDVKTKLKEADTKLTVLQNLQVEEALSASGGKFIDSNMYLFNVNFQTPRGTKIENIYLGLSPLAQMVEEKDGTTYYWHRLFGAYDYDTPTKKIIRQNPFKNITSNTTLINNFDEINNMYFIVFKKQAASKVYEYAYIYSNKGSLMWKNKVYPKINDDAKNVIEQSKKNTNEMLKNGNMFQIKINSRFLVDKTKIEMYPGIDLKALKNEQGSKQALNNHDTLMKILYTDTQ